MQLTVKAEYFVVLCTHEQDVPINKRLTWVYIEITRRNSAKYVNEQSLI